MQVLEINNPISKQDMQRIVKVLKAFGISATFKDDKEMTKEQFINKIEHSRNSKMTKVSKNEQSKLLGL